MGLDCIPKRCGCLKHPHTPDLPDDGATHLPDAPCPFEQDTFTRGTFNRCCWLRGKVAARELEALDKTSISERMYDDMTAEDASMFGAELAEAADDLEQEHDGKPNKPQGAGWNGTWDAKGETWVWENHSTFEEAIASIREAACWYTKVAEHGYGVYAWY